LKKKERLDDIAKDFHEANKIYNQIAEVLSDKKLTSIKIALDRVILNYFGGKNVFEEV